MPLHKHVSKPEWLIPVGLLAISFIPMVAEMIIQKRPFRIPHFYKAIL